ncbi:response regulator [Paenibacillus sp. SYP-B4298]|uniref:response regulator n=1 Tax=Paenibacillus sp. SYP-B4298 TaxID=2996034 RepID=UPI0022DD1AE9|nr:response regulator [Paenibacillus sp. SYP-B4298]
MRVMFVDDEPIIREGLHSLIDWRDAGFDECLEAPNAIAAMELMKASPPDLVITDIFMPEMSGIDFARQAKTEFPSIRFIILTGYEKFEYAREAVAIGISSYLVKPVLPDELKESVQSVVQEIGQEQRTSLINADARRKLDIYKPIVIEKLWADLLSGAFAGTDEMNERMEAAGLQALPGCYLGVSIKLNMNSLLRDPYNDMTQVNGEVRRIAAERLRGRWLHIADAGPGLLRIVLQCEVEPKAYEQLLGECERKLGLSACIGIGGTYPELTSIFKSINEAEEAVHLLSLMESGGVMSYESIPSWRNSHIDYPYVEEKELIEAIRFRDQLDDQPLAPFVRALEAQQAAPQMMKLMFVHLLGTIYRLADEYKAGDSLPPYIENYARLSDMDSVSDIQQFFETCFNQLLAIKARTHAGYVDILVERAKLAMVEGYADSNLSVSTVARLLCITPNYLSRIFHQKTGMTCVEYLTGIRLDEAKKLLIHTSLKNYDIAEKIGYASAHYFSSLFKKNTGLTPSEFRERHGARER